jgi:cell division protein FtsN
MRKNTNIGAVLFGILIGIFFTSLAVFTFSTSEITLKIPGTKTRLAAATATPAAEPIALQEPRFDFYTELTKNATEATPATIPNNPNPAATDLKTSIKAINGYLLQIGSYKKNIAADGLKAKLTLNGFDAKIERLKLLDGEIRYRLMLGPYKTEKQAKGMQQQLKSLDVESLLVPKYAA